MSTNPQKILVKGDEYAIKHTFKRNSSFTTCQPGMFVIPGSTSGEVVVNSHELNSTTGTGVLKMIVLENDVMGQAIFDAGSSDTTGYIYASGEEVPVAVLYPGMIVECLLDDSAATGAIGTPLALDATGRVRPFTGSTTTATEHLIGYAMEDITASTSNVTKYCKVLIA